MKFLKVNQRGWEFYADISRQNELRRDVCGKWMYFIDDSPGSFEFAQKVCEEAVKTGVVIEAKHTEYQMLRMVKTGVCCFYCNGNDNDAHKRVLSFFLKNNMIKKTKSGKLYNISFKYDEQTRNCEYGDDFKAEIKLEQFVDLNTGKML